MANGPIVQSADALVFIRPFQEQIAPIIRAIPHFVAIAGRSSLLQAEALDRLKELEARSRKLHAVYTKFEKAAAALPPAVAAHSRITDFRHSVASTRGLLEQARFALEQRSKIN